MKVTTKGQVTIPQAVRDQLGIHPGSEVAFEVDGDVLKLVPTKRAPKPDGALAARMRGLGDVRMSTEEILALTRGEG
jgi:AbrB family looped-hinge helix DNA binding protein